MLTNDVSEASVNKPLLYAIGWGKKQAFCLYATTGQLWTRTDITIRAFGPCCADDVSPAYIVDWVGACQDRRRTRKWRETALERVSVANAHVKLSLQVEQALLQHTVSLRLALHPDERSRLGKMDALQIEWISDEDGRLEEVELEELGGRTSGPTAWRAKRQELGLQNMAPPTYRGQYARTPPNCPSI